MIPAPESEARGFPDPKTFPNYDAVDSATVVLPADGYRTPTHDKDSEMPE